MPTPLPPYSATRLHDRFAIVIHANANTVRSAVHQIGGRYGWGPDHRIWVFRGWINRLLGGPGLGNDPGTEYREVGDQVDFWEITEASQSELRFCAQMGLLGKACLIFSWNEIQPDQTRLICEMQIDPPLFPGVAIANIYWLLSKPGHKWAFTRLLKWTKKRSEEETTLINSPERNLGLNEGEQT